MSDLTRRDFLGKTSIYGGSISLALAAGLPQATEAAAISQSRQTLTKSEWDSVEAMTDLIIPSDGSPGATEANCVNFIDKALAHEEQKALSMVQNSLSALDRYCHESLKENFSSLSTVQQKSLLATMEDNEMEGWPSKGASSAQFFGFIRALTIMGFLADPKYGGNNNFVGWQLAGYPGPRHHRGGYSDAQMMGTEVVEPIWNR